MTKETSQKILCCFDGRCGAAATLRVTTKRGTTLHYCNRHKHRAEDQSGRYHSGAERAEQIEA